MKKITKIMKIVSEKILRFKFDDPSDILYFDPKILSNDQLMQLLSITDDPRNISIIQSFIHRR